MSSCSEAVGPKLATNRVGQGVAFRGVFCQCPKYFRHTDITEFFKIKSFKWKNKAPDYSVISIHANKSTTENCICKIFIPYTVQKHLESKTRNQRMERESYNELLIPVFFSLTASAESTT